MTRFFRYLALLPIATAVALFVHAFTGTDHAVADGHGLELGTTLVAGVLLWIAWLAYSAFRGRRSGRSLRAALATALPGGGRAEAVAAVLALEGIVAFAGIEASEGRLLAALRLDPVVVAALFGTGAAVSTAIVRTLAGWAARLGVALAERVDTATLAIARFRLATFVPPLYERLVVRVDRGRAPPR